MMVVKGCVLGVSRITLFLLGLIWRCKIFNDYKLENYLELTLLSTDWIWKYNLCGVLKDVSDFKVIDHDIVSRRTLPGG